MIVFDGRKVTGGSAGQSFKDKILVFPGAKGSSDVLGAVVTHSPAVTEVIGWQSIRTRGS
jgi:predicted aconitase with swiveling domain